MSDDRAIGVFDSGVGGLTVLRALMEAMPHERFVYLGDTARLPYGNKSAKTVTDYALQCAQVLLEHPIKAIVIACNTASSVALAPLQDAFDIPVFGVIEPGAKACVELIKTGRVLVLATSSTTQWHAYQKAIVAQNASLEVMELACPMFVAMAEEGWTDGELVESMIERSLEPVDIASMDCILLGCTHFPLLKEAIAKVVGPIPLVDSASTTASHVQRTLTELNLLSSNKSASNTYLATDSMERFSDMASRFLGVSFEHNDVVLVSPAPNAMRKKA